MIQGESHKSNWVAWFHRPRMRRIRRIPADFSGCTRLIRLIHSLSSSQFCLTRRHKGTKLKIAPFVLLVALCEFREVLSLPL